MQSPGSHQLYVSIYQTSQHMTRALFAIILFLDLLLFSYNVVALASNTDSVFVCVLVNNLLVILLKVLVTLGLLKNKYAYWAKDRFSEKPLKYMKHILIAYGLTTMSQLLSASFSSIAMIVFTLFDIIFVVSQYVLSSKVYTLLDLQIGGLTPLPTSMDAHIYVPV